MKHISKEEWLEGDYYEHHVWRSAFRQVIEHLDSDKFDDFFVTEIQNMIFKQVQLPDGTIGKTVVDPNEWHVKINPFEKKLDEDISEIKAIEILKDILCFDVKIKILIDMQILDQKGCPPDAKVHIRFGPFVREMYENLKSVLRLVNRIKEIKKNTDDVF